MESNLIKITLKNYGPLNTSNNMPCTHNMLGKKVPTLPPFNEVQISSHLTDEN